MPLQARSSPAGDLNQSPGGKSSGVVTQVGNVGGVNSQTVAAENHLSAGHQLIASSANLSSDAKYSRAVRSADREDLGVQRFRDFEATTRWINRHPHTNRRFFCNQAKKFVFLAFSEFFRGRSDCEVVVPDFRTAWDLIFHGKKEEAGKLVQVLAPADCYSGRGNEFQLELDELRLDIGFKTEGSTEVAARRLEQHSLNVINGWRLLHVYPRFTAALLRHANLLRAYPDVFSGSHRLATEAVETAERLLRGASKRTETAWIMLKREAVHRRLQLVTREGAFKRQASAFDELRELNEAVATPAAKIHGLALEATHYMAAAQLSRSYDSLKAAEGIMQAHDVGHVSEWALMRAKIELDRNYGRSEDAEQAIEHFRTIWNKFPCPYQKRNLLRWQVDPSALTQSSGEQIAVESPPLVEALIRLCA